MRILVVDDEESIRTMMRMTLELDGHEVYCAANGEEALEMFRRLQPPVVLLDVKLPGIDGLAVLQQIKRQAADTEIIVITGHGDMDMAIECLRNEAANFLTKPVSDDLLSLALKRSEERLALKQRVRQYTENLETLVREGNVALEQAYRFRENLIENSPDAIVSVRKGGDINIFNTAAERLLGYRKDEVLGKMNIVDLYPAGMAKQIMKDLRSNDYGGKGVLQKREMHLVSKDGTGIPVWLSASILYEGGREAGSVGIFTVRPQDS